MSTNDAGLTPGSLRGVVSIRRLSETIDTFRREWKEADKRVLQWIDLGPATGGFEKLARDERAPMVKLLDSYYMSLQSALPYLSESLQRDLMKLARVFERTKDPRAYWPQQIDQLVRQIQLLLGAALTQAAQLEPSAPGYLDPDHHVLVGSAIWSKSRTEQFDASDDPIGYAREWLRGYEFRLAEADRARHFPGATQASHRKCLEWADDPKRDRQHEALDVLLQRIRQHPRPPYSPEVLIGEFQRLFEIAVHARLRDGFVGRLEAWFDRVEMFLSIGAPVNGETAPANDEATSGSKEGSESLNSTWPPGEWRLAAWLRQATRDGLDASKLQKAAERESIQRHRLKAGDDWRYEIGSVKTCWPEYRVAIDKKFQEEFAQFEAEPNGTERKQADI